jgi:16S rRNA (cytidine1402-2'-O)-methyltransferase
LHLVATPIGNAGDLSLRALDTLLGADLVLCEDTRVTGRLLRLHGHRRRLVSYHEHNAARMRPQVLERLRAGLSVVLASDAGTPLVSDPGYKLVREAIAAGIEVSAVPGPSAALAALTVSGLPTDRFLVVGFLPQSPSARSRALSEIGAVPATLVLFEAARRLPATLRELVVALGPRPAAVARELTKRFEEVRRGALDELAAHYEATGAPRGEVVVVIGQREAGAVTGASEDFARQVDLELEEALLSMAPSAAAARVAASTGRPRREVYRRALELKQR